MTDSDWQHGGFGLYVHWPFCQAKCPYCDFNSHVVEAVDDVRWAAAYLSEIERVSSLTRGRVLGSVFFGGGTPSLMAPDAVAAILEAVRSSWPTANDLEVTLEANPTSVEAAKLRAFREAGVNRVSVGIQALNDADLKRLGRLHSAGEARAAYDVARRTFDRVSFDLIYARQDQNAAAWRQELQQALAMGADHMSMYQLTIEDGTAFGDRYARGGLTGLPDEDLAASLYDLTQELCAAAGLPAYEVSNHARPGSESRHNLVYWRYGDYAGIGPGAHGRLTLDRIRYATETEASPMGWLRHVERRRSGEIRCDRLSSQDTAIEYAIMSMRLQEGMDLQRYQELAGSPVDQKALDDLVGLDMVAMSSGRISATTKGRRVLNSVIRALLGEPV